MKAKPIVPRQAAHRDIEQAIDHYMNEGGADLALRFIDALEIAFHRLSARPATGAPRYATELDLPGLRFWLLKRFPHPIFYVDLQAHVDMWRVLHGQQDIPARLQVMEG